MAHWRSDKAAFRARFDLGYDDFVELVNALSEADLARYESLRAVDDKAAILWAIDQGRKMGLLVELDEERGGGGGRSDGGRGGGRGGRGSESVDGGEREGIGGNMRDTRPSQFSETVQRTLAHYDACEGK